MQYKGYELPEVTEPQIIEPPREMIVWDYGHPDNLRIRLVCAILQSFFEHRVVCYRSNWKFCAEIPKDFPEELKRRLRRD